MGQFIYVVRKRIKLDANEALFVLVNKNLQPSSKIMFEIYENNKSDDNFLYIEYVGKYLWLKYLWLNTCG